MPITRSRIRTRQLHLYPDIARTRRATAVPEVPPNVLALLNAHCKGEQPTKGDENRRADHRKLDRAVVGGQCRGAQGYCLKRYRIDYDGPWIGVSDL